MHELGFGVRLATYAFTEQEMFNALETLLNDEALGKKLRENAAQIQSRDGLGVASALIEKVALAHKTN
ncbi:MAG: hypothetical protein EBY82_03210 [Actinobacteria bacterium]|nr:hypothetical protein [Actinomycetota bacterium]